MSYRVIAKENMEAKPVHTWTKGLDYEVVEKQNFFLLASNEGQLAYINSTKEEVLSSFRKEDD